jgi:hypothetical protein
MKTLFDRKFISLFFYQKKKFKNLNIEYTIFNLKKYYKLLLENFNFRHALIYARIINSEKK